LDLTETTAPRAFVLAIYFEVISHSAALFHAPVGLRQQHAGRLGEPRAGRFEFLERCETRLQTGQLVLSRAHRAGAPFMFDARAGQFGVARRPRDAGGLDRVLSPPQAVGGGRSPGRHALGLDAHVAGLSVEFRQRLGNPFACGRSVLERVT